MYPRKQWLIVLAATLLASLAACGPDPKADSSRPAAATLSEREVASPVFSSRRSCRALISRNFGLCDHEDCRALILGARSRCVTEDCEAMVLRRYAGCESRDCRAVIVGSQGLCATNICRAIVTDNVGLCF